MANKQSDCSHKPQFFKILLDDFAKNLSIPQKFVNNVIGYKCKKATIRSPSGKSWHVKINRHMNHSYFGEGWEEFVDAHDLRHGYFLEFTYEGNMVFKVKVFDLSTCEKEYASIDPGRGSDNDTEHFNDSRGKTLIGSDEKHRATTAKPSTSLSMERSVIAKEPRKCLRGLTVRGRHFEVTIKVINLERAYMHIPLKSEAYDDLLSKCQINLRNSKGNLWQVSVLHMERKKHIDSCFGSGWKEFCRDNYLEEGDTCIFELVPEEKDVMQVHVFKKSEKIKKAIHFCRPSVEDFNKEG